MTIIEHREVVDSLDAVQLGLQGSMVGRMIGRAPPGHFSGVRFLPGVIEGQPVEIG